MNLTTGSMDLTTLCSNPEKCFCWLIILLDIFAIFYLVFVSFYKVTKLVRMIGWIWIGVLLTADIIILAVHPCILTLLCILFTIMIMAAMLSVVLPNAGNWEAEASEKKDDGEKPRKKTKCGSYVVREITSRKYCFELYDKQDRFLVRSLHCYLSVPDAKQAIASTRESGQIAEVEDRTANWIKEVNHPKFEIFKDGEKFRFKLSSDSRFVIFESAPFDSLQECKKQLDKTVAAVGSFAVYISVERLTESEARPYADMKAIGEEEPAVPVVQMVPEEPIAPIAPVAPAEPEKPAEPEPVEATEPEAVELKADNGAIVINAAEKKTLWELYGELSAEQKAFFNGLRKAAQEKADAREREYPGQLCYMLFKSNLLRLRIRRDAVEAVFMLMDPAFKKMENSGDAKIKEQKTVIRVVDDTYYALALETLDKKYDLLIEQRNERENQKKSNSSKNRMKLILATTEEEEIEN